MQLVKPDESHLVTIMKWFTTEQEVKSWAGPKFRYPYSQESFKEDLNHNSTNSWSLTSEQGVLIAFGQYYLRLGKCHLGRLVVNPEFRGQGFISHLMEGICKLGMNELAVESCSLVVLESNESAKKAYERFGFQVTDYPESIPSKHCLYMVKHKESPDKSIHPIS